MTDEVAWSAPAVAAATGASVTDTQTVATPTPEPSTPIPVSIAGASLPLSGSSSAPFGRTYEDADAAFADARAEWAETETDVEGFFSKNKEALIGFGAILAIAAVIAVVVVFF